MVARGAWSALIPTNMVPCSPTQPYGVFRRKMWPNSSWSVRATCEVTGRSDSSTLSCLVRPITRSCCSRLNALQAAASWTHFCSRRTDPPAPGESCGTSTCWGATSSEGFSVPSMNPVRSRSRWYDQLTVSSARPASSARAAIMPRAASKTTSLEPPATQSTRSCWVAGMLKPSIPTTGSTKPWRSRGDRSGATARHSSGRNPVTRFTPPIVVRGSDRSATASTRAGAAAGSRRSSSR